MKKNWTKREDDFLIKHYPDTPTSKLQYCLLSSMSSVYGRAKKFNLSKSEEFNNGPYSGRIKKGQQLSPATTFKPGKKPFNKGMKMIEFASPETVKKFLSNSFKKGNQPHNTKCDGFISIRNDKTGRQYKWIRLSKSNWQMLHVHLWTKEHGPVPEGHVLTFIDGDSLNCQLSNIQLVSNEQHINNQRFKDGCIINYLAPRNPELKKAIAKHPQLIELKRTELLLTQTIKSNDNN